MNKLKKKAILALAEKYRGSAEPPCPYFGTCGGCLFQDIEYSLQLQLKKEYLNDIFQGKASFGSVVPSVPYGYRNRMDYVVAFGKMGLREPGQYRNVVDIVSCVLLQEKSRRLYEKMRPAVIAAEGYNYLKHTGYLRYVILRQGYFTGQAMVSFMVARRENHLDEIVRLIDGEADSVSVLLNEGRADISFGEVLEDLKVGHIEEGLEGLRFRITPNSFFQSNSPVALELYRGIRREVCGRVLDLYSGVGSISLFVAGQAEKVTGVEFVAEAVATAEINREINGTGNVEFVCADAKPFMRAAEAAYDTVILDPPRSGMNPRVLAEVIRLAPKKIIYVSCNPSELARDMDLLGEYELASLEAYDMFPQTPHVEAIAVFRRR